MKGYSESSAGSVAFRHPSGGEVIVESAGRVVVRLETTGRSGAPRSRGDEPVDLVSAYKALPCSPRMRGWFRRRLRRRVITVWQDSSVSPGSPCPRGHAVPGTSEPTTNNSGTALSSQSTRPRPTSRPRGRHCPNAPVLECCCGSGGVVAPTVSDLLRPTCPAPPPPTPHPT